MAGSRARSPLRTQPCNRLPTVLHGVSGLMTGFINWFKAVQVNEQDGKHKTVVALGTFDRAPKPLMY